MIINRQVIKTLKPCKDRFYNYMKQYGDRSFTVAQFMGLKKITHKDKLWVCFMLMPKANVALAAADIAASVVDNYVARAFAADAAVCAAPNISAQRRLIRKITMRYMR